MHVRANIVRVGLALAVCAGALVAPVGTALAHPLVDEGRRHYEEAEFARALDALGRAEAASDLEVDDVVMLFETRALVHLATGDEDAMRADLRRLVAIAPTHAPGRDAPPDVMRAIQQIRAERHGLLRVLPSTEAAAAGITIAVRVENDWADVVREVRTSGRVQGATDWQQVRDASLLVTTAAGDVVEYYAEAIGPGGAVLARSGSDDDPLRVAGSDAPVQAGGEAEVWPWIVGGALVALAAGAIVTAVVLTSDSGTVSTQVEPFVVRF
ncbi:MAG: hypothetical protein M3Y87_24345 [Myxococcota bacterium]|nr:hypothetical protein [Myxococcota bacterium]